MTVICIAVFILIYILGLNVSDSYKITAKENLRIDTPVPVTAVIKGEEKNASKDTYDVSLKMFGIIPISDTKVQIIDKMHVVVLGTPFGMKLYTDGVLISKLEDVVTDKGECNPAKDVGINVGDYIKYVNDIEITDNEDLSEIVTTSLGEKLKFTVIRSGKSITKYVTPVKDKASGVYRVGIWVKDSSAGIGTLTFYNPGNNTICGLGHGVCDEDTDKILSLDRGELVGAEILGVSKGKDGEPGELKGRFTALSLSNKLVNNSCGVFGIAKTGFFLENLTEVCPKQDIKNGKGEILATINGNTPKLYECEISVRKTKTNSKTQNLIVKVTDEKLIAKTGGIVQGMSGSPIIQNGKLIGAVTHVLVDNPTTGYGIFAENMLETAQSLADENKLKDAS